MDAALQDLRRTAVRDPEARARLMQAAVRAGELDASYVVILAQLREPAALLLHPELAPTPGSAWEARMGASDLLVLFEEWGKKNPALLGATMVHIAGRVIRARARSGLAWMPVLDTCRSVLAAVRAVNRLQGVSAKRSELMQQLRGLRAELAEHYQGDLPIHSGIVQALDRLAGWGTTFHPEERRVFASGFLLHVFNFTQRHDLDRWIAQALLFQTLGIGRLGRTAA